ncbi:hypothetical protein ACFOTA_09220 [Chitinophaga sp. GCM10012297]|uniref:Alcohol acetyltransferase n=1 Tax=Chitinophaga chungangae TaxID=2821488 RepID=A0ABS3YCH9_9BACT|nr:hypothetical protein [Chitinophaga chungangae]MBO9152382.1 hypothetical protein [Chitinophaga chungangae]
MKPPIHHNDLWFRLDNAAKIYPAIRDRELTSVFRIGVELKERIRAKEILEAVNGIENRFPYYKVKLRAGFFWYYLEPENLPVAVEADTATPCRSFEKNELMFRVLVRENRISVEFSHILTDGTGAFEFLKTLLAVYFEKCCLPVPPDFHHFDAREAPHAEESADAYNQYFKKINVRQLKVQSAFHVPFQLKGHPRFDVLKAVVPSRDIVDVAKKYNVSLTEYLTAVYLYSLQQLYEELSEFEKRTSNKILRIEVPVNLRRIFPSRTMRNFSLYVIPGIDLRLGHFTFEEIVKTVYHQMQLETDKKLISKMISRNVSGERNAFLRRVPLFIKSFIMSRLYATGTKQYSGVVTNLGKVDLGKDVNALIDKFIFIPPPPSKVLKVNCALVGFEDKLVLAFGNITRSRELERIFLSFLAKSGIPVKIYK